MKKNIYSLYTKRKSYFKHPQTFKMLCTLNFLIHTCCSIFYLYVLYCTIENYLGWKQEKEWYSFDIDAQLVMYISLSKR